MQMLDRLLANRHLCRYVMGISNSFPLVPMMIVPMMIVTMMIVTMMIVTMSIVTMSIVTGDAV